MRSSKYNVYVMFILLGTTLSYTSCEKGFMLVKKTASSKDPIKLCVNYDVQNSTVKISTESAAPFYPLIIPSTWDACSPIGKESVDVVSKIVLVDTLGCHPWKKSYIIFKEGGVGVIVNELSTVEDDPMSVLEIPVAWVKPAVAAQLKDMGDGTYVALFFPKAFDYSWVVMFAIAIFCVVVGCYWCGVKYLEHLEGQSQLSDEETSCCERCLALVFGAKLTTTRELPWYISAASVALILTYVTALLISTFYFYKYLVHVLIASFFIFSAVAMLDIIDELFHIICHSRRFPWFKVPCLNIRVEYVQLVLGVCCFAFAGCWVAYRNDKVIGWLMLDMLGVFMMLWFVKGVKFANLLIVTLLSVAFFLYYLFFVFITPLLTKDRKSIMAEVSLSDHDEKVPSLFRILALKNIYGTCRERELAATLGYADIFIPGLAISFAHCFGLETDGTFIYYICTVPAYGLGLILTYMAIYFMESSQPALLYLVPCVLITIYVIAICRRELKNMLLGIAQPRESPSPELLSAASSRS